MIQTLSNRMAKPTHLFPGKNLVNIIIYQLQIASVSAAHSEVIRRIHSPAPSRVRLPDPLIPTLMTSSPTSPSAKMVSDPTSKLTTTSRQPDIPSGSSVSPSTNNSPSKKLLPPCTGIKGLLLDNTHTVDVPLTSGHPASSFYSYNLHRLPMSTPVNPYIPLTSYPLIPLLASSFQATVSTTSTLHFAPKTICVDDGNGREIIKRGRGQGERVHTAPLMNVQDVQDIKNAGNIRITKLGQLIKKINNMG
ncbi:hypothetical protein BKA69DRAFT_1171229 [Paraphysoderma sedebokerense]|nr:hypothetical protein BKA69DRAFT_1171229 [Paraphysoderma sedebokerense]